MTNTIKSLTKANAEKYGFEVREDLNFEDDGNHFRGFSYKGLPITQCRSQGETFLAIRVDYLNSENSFTWKEWRETAEYKLEDEFNGCSEINVEKLIDNCERIIAKIAELNAKTKDEVVDTAKVEEKLAEEIKYAESVVENFKANFKWYEVDGYKLKSLADYCKSEIKNIEGCKNKLSEISKLSRKAKKEMIDKLNEYGYVSIREDDFYLREMKKALEV